MLEVLESRVNHALKTLNDLRDGMEYQHGRLSPPWLDSAIYQLHLALDDIAGYRLAHGGSDVSKD